MVKRRDKRGTPPSCEGCSLADARTGDCMLVTSVDDERARITALRFGMAEGSRIHCVARVPAGPIVLRSGRQEIAVGRGLAQRIRVRHEEARDPRDADDAADTAEQG